MFFFVISCIKLGRFLWNLVHSFPNKFAAASLNVLHLSRIMSLHYTHTCYHRVARDRHWRVRACQLWPRNSPDWNPADDSVWEILLQEKTCKTRITDVDKLIQRLWIEWSRSSWMRSSVLQTSVIVVDVVKDRLWTLGSWNSVSDLCHSTVSCCRCWRREHFRAVKGKR